MCCEVLGHQNADDELLIFSELSAQRVIETWVELQLPYQTRASMPEDIDLSTSDPSAPGEKDHGILIGTTCSDDADKVRHGVSVSFRGIDNQWESEY